MERFIEDNIIKILMAVGVVAVLLFGYGVVGTAGNVEYIKEAIHHEIDERGWRIMRYEGYQHGSFRTHGGLCHYHVCNLENENIQYRVKVSSWNGELQYWYGAPEELKRTNLNVNLKGE